jgi:hypothetical protein
MEVEKNFTKKKLLHIAQNKCIMVKKNINSFINKYENVVEMGLSSPCNDKGKFLSFESYKKSLFIARETETKF